MIIEDGPNTAAALQLLSKDISSASLNKIKGYAVEVLSQAVDPIGGAPDAPSDGLVYGLIQSGKTSVITVTTALAVDNKFGCILILTSDIDLLYDQTLGRIRKAMRGIQVLGKNEWKDPIRFERCVRMNPFVIVCSKNNSMLSSLLDSLRQIGKGGAKGLATLIVDDEADHASLNTKASKRNSEISAINQAISEFRKFFPINTYLQVTATPQALFLQAPSHRYRPSFTVLTEPGPDYVGGDEFFGPHAKILRPVPLNEVDDLVAGNQPNPSSNVPGGMRKALLAFLIGATAKVTNNGDKGYAFLCHVSVKKLDHQYVVSLIDKFKEEIVNTLKAGAQSSAYQKLLVELQAAYDDLKVTEPSIQDLSKIIEKIEFLLGGAVIKLINASSKDEVDLTAAYNIFVGGNKLGRGVTIDNLLVSYYGRNPKKPNADTVLQHARMYGYRRKDLGVTRLFLPDELAEWFRLIHQMESGLRDVVQKYPGSKLEGVYVASPLEATRRNVLDLEAIGYYVSGKMYNPVYPLSTPDAESVTKKLDSQFGAIGNRKYTTVPIDDVIKVVEDIKIDPAFPAELWRPGTLKMALQQLKKLGMKDAYLYTSTDRNLRATRRETQGNHDSGEDATVPSDLPTLFLFRKNPAKQGEVAVWWPQLRFPTGKTSYVIAFSL